MALVKTNSQNELGDIIAEPCVELNRSEYSKSYCFTFWFRGLYRNGGSKFISMGLVKINPQNELGDIISGPLVALVNGTWHPVFFISVYALCMLWFRRLRSQSDNFISMVHGPCEHKPSE